MEKRFQNFISLHTSLIFFKGKNLVALQITISFMVLGFIQNATAAICQIVDSVSLCKSNCHFMTSIYLVLRQRAYSWDAPRLPPHGQHR